MADYMTRDARTVAICAYEHAIRLGHRYLGGEHFLLALVSADQPAGAVLRGRGVTPERVEGQIVRLAGAGLFGGLDRGALAAIGIGVEHLALGLLAVSGGPVPPILAALGVSAPALRAAILDRYRQAS